MIDVRRKHSAARPRGRRTAAAAEDTRARLLRHAERLFGGWVRFLNATMATHQLAAPGLDPGLLLITLEGILHNHVLAVSHYRHLFGRDVSNPQLQRAPSNIWRG